MQRITLEEPARSDNPHRKHVTAIAGLLGAFTRAARSEVGLSLRATASVEWLWLFARLVVITVSVGASFVEWQLDGAAVFIYIAGGVALAFNGVLLVLLRKGRVRAVFFGGFAMDNIALLFGWTGSLWLLTGAMQTNDLYLALFPVLTLWASRLGFAIGVPYVVLWLSWVSWTFIQFFPAQSYEVRQLPLRLVFLALSTLLGMWIAYILRKERLGSERSEMKALQLKQLDSAKNEFISGVSHDLRTPLAAMLGFTRVLKASSGSTLSQKQFQQLDMVERNGERLDRMIDDLLDLSRFEAGRVTLVRGDVSIDDLLEEVASSASPMLSERRQTLELDTGDESIWITADRDRLAQVISNLLTNASKYSPHETAIVLRARSRPGTVMISVIDHGNGISAADQENLFRMFYRTDDARRSGVSGSGIGLYVAKQIVELHGGTVRVASAPGRGTVVAVELPGGRQGPLGSAGLIDRTVAFGTVELEDAS